MRGTLSGNPCQQTIFATGKTTPLANGQRMAVIEGGATCWYGALPFIWMMIAAVFNRCSVSLRASGCEELTMCLRGRTALTADGIENSDTYAFNCPPMIRSVIER